MNHVEPTYKQIREIRMGVRASIAASWRPQGLSWVRAKIEGHCSGRMRAVYTMDIFLMMAVPAASYSGDHVVADSAAAVGLGRTCLAAA